MSITIIGAGLAGLSAAHTLAQNGIACTLVSAQASERAQSVMAEGGINACLNTMGENDSIDNHIEDTLRGGVGLADRRSVRGLCESAPAIVREFHALGVPFPTNENGIVQRHFGGQKKKRTAFVKSSTGKMLMTALIDAVRRYEAEGLVRRYPHHMLQQLHIRNNCCQGATVFDTYTGESLTLGGSVILASGGMNGLFWGLTTGTTQNTADVTAMCLESGVELANLEFIQYHPTTIAISGKRLLISEAARGEGGRLFVRKNGKPWYFMEEKYPELKNLMPRDVVSAEMVEVTAMPECEAQVYLDMTGIDKTAWKSRLSDLREQVLHYLTLDPVKTPVPVSPGIHYFMGGIWVDAQHRTSAENLYAAGECACRYHGANRLGGNSLLGAVYGGKIAAMTALKEADLKNLPAAPKDAQSYTEVSPAFRAAVSRILGDRLKILRSENDLRQALTELASLESKAANPAETRLLSLAKATVSCALFRKESRGAHRRTDYPATDSACQKQTVVQRTNVFFREIDEL